LPALSLPKGAELNAQGAKTKNFTRHSFGEDGPAPAFSYITKCPFTNPSCNDHPKTAQNCHRKRKKYEFLPRNDKKCALFTKKYQKIPIFHHFFVANAPQTYPFATN